MHDHEQLELLTKLLTSEKCKHLIGISEQNLHEIRQWNEGILLIDKKECRGIDTRFAKDSVVLIISSVESYHHYLQMLGRSSRSRNVCEGILYCPTSEKKV